MTTGTHDAASVRLLVAACSAVASGSAAMLERDLAALAAAVHAGRVPHVAAEEALLQCYLFLGYPAALRGLGVWRRVSGLSAVGFEQSARNTTGLSPEDGAGSAKDDGEARVDEWLRLGGETCRTVYGGQYDRLRTNIAALHPDMERWMVMEGYGKVLSRPGLPLWMRECCIVAVLGWQDAAPQLYSHLRGALNAGASRAVVEQTVQQVMDELPAERRQMVEAEWGRVLSRRE